jgi:N-acetylglutamate synthase-like GNAT family acetyltransferase
MSDSFPLPAGCTLRPAKITDKPKIQQMLKNLEREIAPESAAIRQQVWGIAITLVIMTLSTSSLPWVEIRTLFQIVVASIVLAALLVCLATWVMQEREWTQYWVIEFNGYLVACAKLQRHGHYSALFDLYVVPDWRRKGVGSCLVNAIGQKANKPLYLACLPARLPFYQRLGFSQVAPKRLSPLIRYDLGLPTRPNIIPMMLSRD